MKRIFILCILCLVNYFNIYSQGKFDFQIEASPNYSFRTFKNNSDYNITTDDESKIGYSIALKSGFRITQNIHIISGFEYSNKGYKTNMAYLDEQNNFITTLGTLDLLFLEIPLYLKYQFSFSDFSLSPILGMSYGRLIGIQTKHDNEKNSSTQDEIKESSYNRNDFNLHGGLELIYHISGKIGVKVEPKVDYTLTDLFKGEGNVIEEHLFIIGINIGFIITI